MYMTIAPFWRWVYSVQWYWWSAAICLTLVMLWDNLYATDVPKITVIIVQWSLHACLKISPILSFFLFFPFLFLSQSLSLSLSINIYLSIYISIPISHSLYHSSKRPYRYVFDIWFVAEWRMRENVELEVSVLVISQVHIFLILYKNLKT